MEVGLGLALINSDGVSGAIVRNATTRSSV